MARILKIRGKDGNWLEVPALKGSPGVSWVPSVSESGVLSWTNDGGLENPSPVDLRGVSGVWSGSTTPPEGYTVWVDPSGDPTSVLKGATLTPSVDDLGNLSWTNDQGLVNPETKNIKGEPGKDAVIDATLTQAGQAADAAKTGEAIGQLKNDLANKIDKYVTTISVNRFDKTKTTNGTLIAANGNIINQETATSFVSDFCDIAKENTSGFVSVARASRDNWLVLQGYSFYDKDKTFISGAYTYTNPLSIPSNAVYIRFQMANSVHVTNTVCNIGTELYKNDYEYNNTEVVIPTKTSQLVNDYNYVTQSEIDRVRFENQNLRNRCASLEDLNRFAWEDCDKGYITLVFDDGSADLGLAYEIAQEYGLFISAAVPPERLSLELSGSTMTGTVKDACDAIVASGGEVLTHTLSTLNREGVTEQDFYSYFAQNKMDLENAGFVINGIITAGAGYADKSVTLKWARQYYLYSDGEGAGQGYPQYEKSRYAVYGNTTTNNVEQIKTRIANAVTNKTWIALCLHTISESSVLGTSETLLRDLFSAIKGYIDNGTLRNATYNYMYNHFGSTELEQRIKAIENL